MPLPQRLLWTALAIVGAVCLGAIALNRGEHINSIWLVLRFRLHVSARVPLLRGIHRCEGDGAR
jgi:hypothetical protein